MRPLLNSLLSIVLAIVIAGQWIQFDYQEAGRGPVRTAVNLNWVYYVRESFNHKEIGIITEDHSDWWVEATPEEIKAVFEALGQTSMLPSRRARNRDSDDVTTFQMMQSY